MASAYDFDLRRVSWTNGAAVSPLLETLGIDHGFQGRAGGVPRDCHSVKQVHGTEIIVASLATSAEATEKPPADALMTRTHGTAVAVKTADCLPVLLCDRERRAVSAIHAGWRGLSAGILGKAVAMLISSGASSLVAAVGPAISRERYEVGSEVIEAWLSGPEGASIGPGAAFAVAKGLRDRWHLDLATAAALSLINAGIEAQHIEVMQACTFSEATSWFSFRREGKGVGSNWSWIRAAKP